jgi:hypothetical protein
MENGSLPNGRICLVGWLGRLVPIPGFNPLLQMASGVHFSLLEALYLALRSFRYRLLVVGLR